MSEPSSEPVTTKDGKPDKGRRRFIKLTLLGGSGLVLGVYFTVRGEKTKTPRESWGDEAGTWTPNAWLRVDKDGQVTVRVSHSEMGQGVSTGLATLVAEELGVDWKRVTFEHAPVEPVYKNPLFGTQMTGGSTATPANWERLREAGAAARMMLISAAAAQWSVDPNECRSEHGAVVHTSSGRSVPYGELVTHAESLEPPDEVKLTDPAKYRLIGTDVPRLDVEAKVEGSAVYGIDVEVPGMLNATVIHPPVFNDEVDSFDAKRALSMPGVKRVFAIDTGVAVVAERLWQAFAAADVVKVKWRDRGDHSLTTDAIWKRWEQLAGGDDAVDLEERGDFTEAFRTASTKIEVDYRVPFQAHATPEPMCCTAFVEKDRCRIWVPTQFQDGTQEVVAQLTGLGYANIDVTTTYLGGGFGRRGEVDFVVDAVLLSQAMGAPVKVVWSREEDMRHDMYRAACLHRMRAGLDAGGKLVAWSHRIVGPDLLERVAEMFSRSSIPYGVPRGARDIGGCAGRVLVPTLMSAGGVKSGAAPLAYAVDSVLVDAVLDDPGVPVGFWRSVADSANAFAVECFFDEIAVASKKDPLALRKELLKNEPRLLKVLDRVGRESGWDSPPTAGVHRGLACHAFHGTPAAMVAEVSVSEARAIRVHRVVCAVDCGRVINPKNVRAQIAGGVAFGLTATLKGGITLRDGQVEQGNFDDFPLLTIDEMPKVEVHVISSQIDPTGIGEVGVPPIAPAVANAVSAATGKRIRELPIRLA